MRAFLVILALLCVSSTVAMQTSSDLTKQSLEDILDAIALNDPANLETYLQTLEENLLKSVLESYDHRGLTPLQVSLTFKSFRPEIIELLLDFGSNPNQPILKRVNMDARGIFFAGYTAAHIAVKCNATRQILMLLLERDTDFLKGDNGNWTAVMLAKKHEHWMAEKLFREYISKEPYIPRTYLAGKRKPAPKTECKEIRVNSPALTSPKPETITQCPLDESDTSADCDESDYNFLWESILSNVHGFLKNISSGLI